jgi:hypothetical protein
MGNNPSSRSYDTYYESLKTQQKKATPSIDDVDAYEVFGLSKDFEWEDLKTSYKRLAKLVHPDKGGSEEIFNKVTDCFKKLAYEYKMRKSDRPHQELKKESQEYYSKNSESGDISRFASTERDESGMSFTERFNKTFEDNRLEEDENTKGYGHMMAESSKTREDISVPTYMKPGKKLDMMAFNKTFETITLPKSSAIVKYKEPEALPLARKMQYSELGETVDDFTSSSTSRDSRGLQYTDYKKAYETGRLVDPRAVEERKEFKTVSEYESMRERVLGTAQTDEELQLKAKKERDAARAEEARLKRLAERDRIIENHHNKMNRLLLSSKGEGGNGRN